MLETNRSLLIEADPNEVELITTGFAETGLANPSDIVRAGEGYSQETELNIQQLLRENESIIEGVVLEIKEWPAIAKSLITSYCLAAARARLIRSSVTGCVEMKAKTRRFPCFSVSLSMSEAKDAGE